MKQFFLGLLLFFGAGFAISRFAPFLWDRGEKMASNVIDLGFRAAPYPIENKSFVVVIVGRNNGAFVEPTLRSVFSQYYENFRLIYIDDASSDGTFEFVKDLVYESPHIGKVMLVKNEEQLGMGANLYRAVQTCENDEIVVVLGATDQLAHEWALQRLNQYFADPDLWLTYGQYREFPSLAMGNSAPFVRDKGFRSHPFPASHMQAFYASLFKKIREFDLISAKDESIAYMAPMLEMASDHFQFIPEILYLVSHRMVPFVGETEHLVEQTCYEPLGRL